MFYGTHPDCGIDFASHDFGVGFILITPEGDFRLIVTAEDFHFIFITERRINTDPAFGDI